MQRQGVMLLIMVLVICNFGLVIYLVKNRQTSTAIENISYLQQSQVPLEQKTEEAEPFIIADTDLGKKTEAAIVAKVGYAVTFRISQGTQTDFIEVAGENGFIEYPEKIEDGFTWTPKRSGVFKVNVVDEEGSKKVSRTINVSSMTEEDYYQLEDISVQENEEGVSFSTNIFSTPKNAEGYDAKPVMAFSIGEENIWTKTIKNYNNTANSITEGKDFILDRGTYFIRAALRDQYSIEDEDYKNISYTREVKDGHEVVIHSIKHSVVDNINNGKSDRFVVDAQCNKGCELVYAFFVSDSVGDKRITEGENGYTESNVFTCPVTPWEYRVSVRVKHKKNSDILEQNEQNPLLLPNAYEALESILVKGDYIEDTIKIKNIQIEPFILTDYYNEKQKWNSIMQTITDSSKNGTVYANNNNYITINIQEEGHYGYDAWVIDDGEQITLEKVEDGESSNRGNKFIYYPKSGGRSGVAANPNETHTLFIQVTQYDEYGYITKKLTKKYTLEVE